MITITKEYYRITCFVHFHWFQIIIFESFNDGSTQYFNLPIVFLAFCNPGFMANSPISYLFKTATSSGQRTGTNLSEEFRDV